jgi:Protein of unknown function (DUF2511)
MIGRFALVLVLVAACSGPGAAASVEPEATDPGYITRAEYGADWPFVVPAGTLSCQPSGANDGRLLVTFDVGDGIEYALNGQAKDFGFPELDESVLSPEAGPVDTLPLIDRGLDLCED